MSKPTKPSALVHNDLFGPGEDWTMNACVGDNGGPATFERYAHGFFEAPRMILKSLTEENRGMIDALVYPMAYSYRHGIELYLKHLLDLHHRFVHTDQFKHHHDILVHWNQLVKASNKLPACQPPKSIFKDVRNLLEQFCAIDSSGETFRYPVGKKGQHLAEQSLINLVVLGEHMDGLQSFFENWAVWVAEFDYSNS